jgi:renalase
MKDFCVVGSGVSGCTIANLLSKKYTVEIFDKGKGLGGRTSNRRYKNNINFDHGLQYISPDDQEYKKFILKLEKKRILKPWINNHIDLSFSKKKVSTKYIGTRNNNDICKYLVKGLKVRFLSTITSIKFEKNCWVVIINKKEKFYFKNLVITCPFPQLKVLAKDYLNKKILNLNVKMQPNITVMAVFKKYKSLPIGSIKFDDNILGFAANENSKKRFKTNLNLWTIQSNYKWAKNKINTYRKNKKNISFEMLKRFETLVGIKRKNLIFSSIHGWKYSYNFKKTRFKSYWLKKYNLGICADWFLGPKAEHAWVSSNDLFKKVKKNPPISRRV